jgi:serine/threonine-protein kinase RIO1
MKRTQCTEDLKVIELENHVNLLKNLLLSAYRSGVKYPEHFLKKEEILNIMGWTEGQFRYRVPELKKFGLVNTGRSYRMSYYNLQRYIDSLYNTNEI